MHSSLLFLPLSSHDIYIYIKFLLFNFGEKSHNLHKQRNSVNLYTFTAAFLLNGINKHWDSYFFPENICALAPGTKICKEFSSRRYTFEIQTSPSFLFMAHVVTHEQVQDYSVYTLSSSSSTIFRGRFPSSLPSSKLLRTHATDVWVDVLLMHGYSIGQYGCNWVTSRP